MRIAATSLLPLLLNPGISSAYTLSPFTRCFARGLSQTTSLPGSMGFHDATKRTMINTRSRTASQLFSTSSETSDLDDISVSLAGPELPPVSPTAKRIFMVRHGEVINPGGDKPVYYGCQDVKLSPLGELEAKAAGAYLKQFNLQNVASSPLTRAKFGANQVLMRQQDTNQEIKIFEGFTEMDRGSWCGKTKDEIGSDMMAKFDACDLTVTPEGGESYPGLKERVLAARDELLKITDDGRASAVVSHLQVTRSMLSDAMGVPVEEMASLKIATASVTCVDYESESGKTKIHFQSFKPDAGLAKSIDGAN